MNEEVSSLKEALQNAKTTRIAGMEFFEGTLDGKNVVVVKCGIGKVNAGTCAQLLINVFGADRIINTGVAGSLDAAIDIGDIVVSTDAVQHDFDLTPLGYAPGELDGLGSPSLPADETMRRSAVKAVGECAPEVHVFEGRVCTGDQFISSAEQKEAILSQFGGLCCEMSQRRDAFIQVAPFRRRDAAVRSVQNPDGVRHYYSIYHNRRRNPIPKRRRRFPVAFRGGSVYNGKNDNI